jgi:hypothetical protein
MRITIVGALLQLLLLHAECTSWQPKLHGVLMKDFGSSRNLPIVSPSGTSGFTSSKTKTLPNSNLSDDVARGGHASVKVASEQTADTDEAEAVASHVETASATPVDVPSAEVKALNFDVQAKNVMSKKKKDTSSAAKIARKLKVS